MNGQQLPSVHWTPKSSTLPKVLCMCAETSFQHSAYLSAFPFSLYRASRWAKDERWGFLIFFSRHVHSPGCACDFLDVWEYGKASQSVLWLSDSPNFHFIFWPFILYFILLVSRIWDGSFWEAPNPVIEFTAAQKCWCSAHTFLFYHKEPFTTPTILFKMKDIAKCLQIWSYLKPNWGSLGMDDIKAQIGPGFAFSFSWY
jgi:hypothetical protein